MESSPETLPEILAQFLFVFLLAAVMFGWSMLFAPIRKRPGWTIARPK